MMERPRISKIEYYGAIVVLILTIAASVAGAGYNLRKIEELQQRVLCFEQSGSVPAQITARDMKWLSENVIKMSEQIDRLERKVDRHMNESSR